MPFQVPNENFTSVHANCSHFAENQNKRVLGVGEREESQSSKESTARGFAVEVWEQ